MILHECKKIVKDLVQNDYLYFDDAVEINTTPHTQPLLVWAVSVSPENELFLMDGDEQWHQLELSDDNVALVIMSLYQRLQFMRVRYAKAS